MTDRIPDAINLSRSTEFTQVPNDLIRESGLSWKAKGIMSALLSNREGWCSYISVIVKMGKDGEDSVRSGLKELEEFGYLVRLRYRCKKTKRFKGTLWGYTDIPGEMDLSKSIQMLEEHGYELEYQENPHLENPHLENPHLENPHLENPGLKRLKVKRPIEKEEKIYNTVRHSPTESVSVPEEDEREDREGTIKETTPPKNKNEEYMPFAEQLATIIKTKQRINKTSSIRSWADDFRKLVQHDLVEDTTEERFARVQRALDWYADNIGGQYVPVILSGSAFRSKFLQIESAIERQEYSTFQRTNTSTKGSVAPSTPTTQETPDHGPGPRPLFRKEFGNDLGDWLFENAFKPLRDVYSGPDGELLRGVTRSNLAQSIVHMLHQIQNRQKNLPSDFFDTHPYYGFMSILKAYVHHLEDARSWLDTPTLAMLDVSHSIFGRFRKQYARDSDHLARDPFTGLPPSSV